MARSRRRPRYLPWRLASLLGLQLGDRIGRIDTSIDPRPGSPYAEDEWDRQHRNTTVVDAYSALVDLLDLQCGGVDVVIQSVAAVEMFEAAGELGEARWTQLFEGRDMVRRIRQDLDEYLHFARRHGRYIEVARSAADVRRIVATDRIAMVLMLQSGWIADDLGTLEQYHDWGLRVIALCHLAPFSWVDSSSAANARPGLSDFGRQVVAACNELGLLVDLSHASDATCRDALEATTAPVIATHSKCRALSGSPRDLSDDLLRGIAATGGVIGILAAAPRSGTESREARIRRDQRLRAEYADPFELATAKLADAEVWSTKLDLAHIDHAVELVGIDHVGLASHAQSSPQWSEYTRDLMQHGYSAEETGKILGGNVLRVLEAVPR